MFRSMSVGYFSLAVCLSLGVIACGAGEAEDVGAAEDLGATSSAVMCGGESRTAITSLTFPRGAVGSLGGCTGTIIGRNKVMTAQHCLGVPPSQLSFRPQFGILSPGTGPSASSPIRITQGRDDWDTEQYADWAILTFANDFQTQLGANYQQMNRVIPTSVPFNVTLAGYHGDFFSNRPGLENCQVHSLAADGNTLLHGCDIAGGASGGPLWAMSGGAAQLLAVQSGHGSGECTGQAGNNAANGKYFSFAPDNAVGLATARLGDGRPRVFASDQDWSLIGYRDKVTSDANGAWTAWNAHDSAFTGGRKMAATNLTDNRQEVWVVTDTGQLRTRWQTAVDGAFSSWVTQSTPTAVKDVAATGASGVTTHLFVLGTDNTVRLTYKTGDANSAWSAWVNLGSVPGALSLAAHTFGGVHEVYAVSSAGAQTAWGSGSSFNSLTSFGTSGGGFKTVTAGVLQDGRANVIAVNGLNSLVQRIRGNDGNWTGWTSMPQANPTLTTGFTSLATARLTDGRQEVFGVGTNGNIYTIWETAAGAFSGTWVRFYK